MMLDSINFGVWQNETNSFWYTFSDTMHRIHYIRYICKSLAVDLTGTWDASKSVSCKVQRIKFEV